MQQEILSKKMPTIGVEQLITNNDERSDEK